MKPRLQLIALAAICAFAAPAAFAQRVPADVNSGQIGYIPGPGIGGTISRTFTTAVLTTPDGVTVGKAKTATVTTTNQTLQALRIQANLAPNTEYAVVVDNALVGTATTNANGALKLRLSDPVGRNGIPLPEAIRPIAQVQSVALYEVSSQRLVASGQFRTGGSQK